MQVSIIIPFFSAGRTLGATIESALAQHEVAPEIVAIDDGSTDNSLAIARSFDPGIRILAGPNQGVSAARNRGIAETAGDWLVFLDSDDLLLPGTLRKRLDRAEAAGADVVACDWQEIIDQDGKFDPGPTKSLDMTALAADPEIACATHVWASTAALMYRRTLVDRIGGFRDDLPVIQDARFLFDAAFSGARFAHSAHIGAQYRVLPMSLSRRDPARFWRDVFANGKQIEALWRARGGLTPKQRAALAAIYDNAGRGLIASGHAEYFEAIERERRLGGRLPLHPRLALPLARTIGLERTKLVLKLLGR